MQKALTLKAYEDFVKSVNLFKKSLLIYKPLIPSQLITNEQEEYYDAFSFRYQKLVETALYYFRTLENYLYQAESVTLRDRLLRMEKLGLVATTDRWMDARELRNKITHAYAPDDLAVIYQQVVDFGKMILQDGTSIQKHWQTLNLP